MPKPIKTWIQELETELKRPLNLGEKEILDIIASIHEKLDWKDELTFKDVSKYKSNKALIKRGSDSISDWTEKPADTYELWPYIATALLDCELSLPDFLSEDPRIDELYETRRRREQKKQARLWRNRLGNLSQANTATGDALIETRLKLAGQSLRWETRSEGDDSWDTTEGKVLVRWLEKDYGFLERFLPQSQIFCSLFREYYKFTQRVRIDLDRPVDCSFVNKLLQHPDTRESIVGSNGETFSFSDRKLAWSGIKRGPDNQGEYKLHLIFDNGDDAPHNLYYLPGPIPLYLANNQLYSGPSMLIGDARPNQTFKIPADALESPEGLLFLRKQDLPLPEKLEGKVVAIPLDTRLYCSLKKADEGIARVLEIRVYSVSKDQGHWFILGSDGWEGTNSFETDAANADISEGTFFDFPDSGTILDDIGDFDLDEEDEPGIWTLEIESGFPYAFSEWIQSLPTNIQIIADDELDSLVDSHPSGRYALDIKASEHPDWFDIQLKPEIIDSSLTDQEAALLLKSKGEYVYLEGKGWRRFEAELDANQQALIDTLGISFQDSQNEKQTAHALQLADIELDKKRYADLAKEVKKRAIALKKPKPAALPKGMKTDLRPYQVEGFKFLAYLSQNKFGGVLADDMGLGKTLQCLTWLTWLKHRQPEETPFRVLVVCPKSVMHVWKNEVKRHSQILEIALFDPNTVNKVSWDAAGIDILVANYSQLRIRRDFFESVDWTVSVLDEGQYIKNPQSQTAKSALALKTEHRLVLTGTPIENKILDLWSLFSFSMPGLLNSQAAFKRQYKDTDPLTAERISKRVRHFMMRRSKKQVAPDLPDRIEETISCQMEDEQLALYHAELKIAQQHIQDLSDSGNQGKHRFNILASLLRMRQICCHPQLIDPSYATAKSAKLEALKEHVASLMEEGHKVLIFSQFVEMLHIIKAELDTLGCRQLMLTGQTRNREELVDQFQTDPNVDAFLLSLKAAGSGLNLTASSYVILYDPWWNPAVEAQAIDRTHRIGQKNTVNAYRLICSDSVEEKIQSLQLKKEELANDIVREDSLNQILDIESLKSILSGD